MSQVNSKYRLDIAVAPGDQQNPALFNELLSAYSGLRVLHSALSGFFDNSVRSQADHAAAEAEARFLMNGISKVVVLAGEAIVAGRFLELYYDTVWKVKHTNITASYLYAGVLGISLESLSAGEFAEVITGPAIISGFSGLTPGAPYFAYTSGQFIDIAGVPRPGGSGNIDLIQCGRALSATKMQLITTF